MRRLPFLLANHDIKKITSLRSLFNSFWMDRPSSVSRGDARLISNTVPIAAHPAARAHRHDPALDLAPYRPARPQLHRLREISRHEGRPVDPPRPEIGYNDDTLPRLIAAKL